VAPVRPRVCPSCGTVVTTRRETCPGCLAVLVDHVEGEVTCPACGQPAPAWRQTCAACLALLRPDPDEVDAVLARALGEGRRLHRRAGRAPFSLGPACSVVRLVLPGPLVLCGADGAVEADVTGRDLEAVPPLWVGSGSELLFRLDRYGAAERALVAVEPDGTPLGTYLRGGSVLEPVIDVRDETSAPVARLTPASGGAAGYRLVETGGVLLAVGEAREVERDGWRDDEWSLTPVSARLPLQPLAFVALALAMKVFLGLLEPTPPGRSARDADGEEAAPS